MSVKSQTSAGFTLPEICLALLISASLLNIGLFSLHELRAHQLLRAVKQLDLQLQHQAEQAVLQQTDVVLDATALTTFLPSKIQLSQFKFAKVGGKPALVYHPSGAVSPGSFVLTQANQKTCKISISLAGGRNIQC